MLYLARDIGHHRTLWGVYEWKKGAQFISHSNNINCFIIVQVNHKCYPECQICFHTIAPLLLSYLALNTLRARQNSQYLAANLFCWMKIFLIWLKFHWNMFTMVQITTSQRWFRKWLNVEQATSHYLYQWWSGHRFNIKMTSYQYRKSHCGDKTILRPSYLHSGISYTGKMSSLYWIRALVQWCNISASMS